MATATWISGNGTFDTPSAWSTGMVPGPADDAVITTYRVTSSVDEMVNSLGVSKLLIFASHYVLVTKIAA